MNWAAFVCGMITAFILYVTTDLSLKNWEWWLIIVWAGIVYVTGAKVGM